MEKNDSDLSGDWHIVASFFEDEKNKTGEMKVVDSPVKSESEPPVEGSSVQDMVDQDSVTHQDSSSDIDIIDENIEESAPTCVLPSSSLTISSSFDKSGDTCSLESQELSDEAVVTPSKSENDESKTSEEHTSEGYQDGDIPEPPYIIFGRPVHDWLNLLLEFLQNMSGLQWSAVLTVTMCLYFCITINQTNIISLQEKGDVVSQMKKMIDELKSDNKQLREQMLSEMKNDKLVSSFENQIRELKKENLKLNRMLYDVVKVLEKQKDAQEKLLQNREAEYQEPFKNEINKLKEHINILKFDNDELQKQLVRMRYASYSQGEKHGDSKDRKATGKGEKHQANENKEFNFETPYSDLHQLRKWDELLNLVIKELGIVENGYSKEEKSGTESGKKLDWNWKNFKNNLKGKIGDFSHINVYDLFSKYMKYNEKMMSNAYESLSTYFKKAQNNAQPILETFQEESSEQQKNIWNVINDLGEKWAQMKKRLYSSYMKNKFVPAEDFATSDHLEDAPKDSNAQNKKDSEDASHANVEFESRKQDQSQSDGGNERWVFRRAALREEVRNAKEEESSINWFLKKGKNVLGDIFNGEERNEESAAEKPKPEF